MAKFNVRYSGDGALNTFFYSEGADDTFSVDDLLEVLRPAAIRLKEYYRETILRLFKKRSGSLADSINFEDDYNLSKGYVSFLVKPFGVHKGGKYTRRSRAGSPNARYAKHNRKPATKAIKNEELAYLLEYGTPRITATHWMETANEEIENEIQDMIEAEFDDLLKKKGLI